MEKQFEKGDRILYQFTHWMNSKSSTQRVKSGVFLRKVKVSPFNTEWGNPRVVIQIDENKNTSIVRLSQIRHE
jgi:hypothetical protein